jgi:transcriptional regulator with XRE-family HTH domain
MGRLYDLIQEHIDSQRYEVREAQVARELGVTQTTLSNWREPKGMVKKEHLEAIARVTQNPYRVVRDAWLEDVGLLHPGASEGSASEVS